MKPPILPFMPLLIKGMFVYKVELYFINVQFSSCKKKLHFSQLFACYVLEDVIVTNRILKKQS